MTKSEISQIIDQYNSIPQIIHYLLQSEDWTISESNRKSLLDIEKEYNDMIKSNHVDYFDRIKNKCINEIKKLSDFITRSNIDKHNSSYVKKLFISYSKSDKEYLEAAKKHLKIFERQRQLRIWDDTQLIPGEKWDEAIKRELAAADIIVFLVSSDLIATDYVWDIEMPIVLAREQAGEVSVVPVIIRPCAWESAPFGQFTGFPSKGKPISSFENEDKAWKEVVKKIETLLK